MAVRLSNDPQYLITAAKKALSESPRQSAAAIKAEALREAIDLMEVACDKRHLRNRIEDIKREGKESEVVVYPYYEAKEASDE